MDTFISNTDPYLKVSSIQAAVSLVIIRLNHSKFKNKHLLKLKYSIVFSQNNKISKRWRTWYSSPKHSAMKA